jgi:imidazoleglycerol-phosphate dehydratase/histidinol-phosphatase
MKKVLFIDRDGTLIKEPTTDYQIDGLEKFRLLPGVISALKAIVSFTDYRLVMVTNQDGLGTASFPHKNFEPYQNLLLDILQSENIQFDAIHIDSSFSHEGSPNRKPAAGMLTGYFNGEYNLSESFVIGDRATDIELAQNIGARSIFIGNEKENLLNIQPDFIAENWARIADIFTRSDRTAVVRRKTRETAIFVELNLDKSSTPTVDTGIGFFNHMLEQIGYHGGMAIKVNAVGDLDVDEHHTIEDVGLTLGMAFSEALVSKRGINRYGFYVPMDEALASVIVDFGGRPFLEWNVTFMRSTIGGVDATLFEHFFASFCQKAQCTLHVSVTGKNDHHMVEAIFKAFARAMRMAVTKGKADDLPSSKGVI